MDFGLSACIIQKKILCR